MNVYFWKNSKQQTMVYSTYKCIKKGRIHRIKRKSINVEKKKYNIRNNKLDGQSQVHKTQISGKI